MADFVSGLSEGLSGQIEKISEARRQRTQNFLEKMDQLNLMPMQYRIMSQAAKQYPGLFPETIKANLFAEILRNQYGINNPEKQPIQTTPTSTGSPSGFNFGNSDLSNLPSVLPYAKEIYGVQLPEPQDVTRRNLIIKGMEAAIQQKATGQARAQEPLSRQDVSKFIDNLEDPYKWGGGWAPDKIYRNRNAIGGQLSSVQNPNEFINSALASGKIDDQSANELRNLSQNVPSSQSDPNIYRIQQSYPGAKIRRIR